MNILGGNIHQYTQKKDKEFIDMQLLLQKEPKWHIEEYTTARYNFPVSSKKDKSRHGFGIKSIQKVVKQYNGNLQMYFDDATNTFHTIITLKG